MLNIFTACDSIFYMKPYSVFDIFQCLIISISLCIATLGFRTKGKITVTVFFDYY
ncbi:hypothetical protein KsCSTR_05470 [Candidatus Kuenenia stuttgartiensis]|uniref:Uncharacterized protein n=1 Tax=Kuenenia stuttgartiensis TaxID=174633 RepID=Q1Q035_KUEST|nr:hypothetical protein KsCSTR_05470 [Candidatus Kuenenia stuttgartiensis]CAJ72693.1 unknown protein [Candidatus Kuenenia stuttgartiensis]